MLAAFGIALVHAQIGRAPSITSQPAPVTEAVGGNVAFSAGAVGVPQPTDFRWFKDGAPVTRGTVIPDASDGSSRFFLPVITVADEGIYSCSATSVLGSTASEGARLTVTPPPVNPGPVDSTFVVRPSLDAPPTVVAVQAGGRVLLGGRFLVLNQGSAQFGVARLNVDGSLDTAYRPPVFAPATDIRALATRDDGVVFVGGALTLIDGTSATVLRLRADGSRDATFNPSVAAPVQLVALPDGKLIVAEGASLARLNADGSRDTTFAQTPVVVERIVPTPLTWIERSVSVRTNATLTHVVRQPDGKLLVAGTAAIPNYVSNRTDYVTVLRRFTADGASDPAFAPAEITGPADQVAALRVLADGRVILASNAVSVFSAQGTLQKTFGSLGFRGVAAIDAQGGVWLSGPYSGASTAIRRLTPQGDPAANYQLSQGFEPAEAAGTLLVALDDGRAYLAGTFGKIDGVERPFFARLNAASLAPTTAPRILAVTPTSFSGREGEPLAIDVLATGSAPLRYRLVTPGGATLLESASARLRFDAPVSGTYRIVVEGPAGQSDSRTIEFTSLPTVPIVTRQPSSVAADRGQSVMLAVEAFGSGALSFQWFKNGERIVGATSASLTLPAFTAADIGEYVVVVRNALGLVTSPAVRVDEAQRLANVSTRALAGRGEMAIATGFVIRGGETEVLVRAVGPGLARFGVTDFLRDPRLKLTATSGPLAQGDGRITENDNWESGSVGRQPEAMTRAGAFPLERTSGDAAIIVSLPPGNYTAEASSADASTGIALIEVYDLGTSTPRLVNLSSRTWVGAGANAAIPGLVISGTAGAPLRRLLIRAIGPSLAAFGVGNVLGDPALTLVDQNGATLTTNDNWSGAAALASAFTSVGAFGLPPSSKDAAIIVALPPGNYTALVRGADGGSGVALVEIYELP